MVSSTKEKGQPKLTLGITHDAERGALPLSGSDVVRHGVADDLEFTILFGKVHLNHFVHQVCERFDLIEEGGKELNFNPCGHSCRTVDTDQSGVDRNVRVLSLGAWPFGCSAEVNAVSRDECPVTAEDKFLEFPVLPPCLSQPTEMETLVVATIAR
jgi:hypothetical protein